MRKLLERREISSRKISLDALHCQPQTLEIIAESKGKYLVGLKENQKQLLKEKLSNRINADGFLLVRSQVHRTQLANKEEVIKKMNKLISKALEKKKARIATKKSKAAKERRLESKKRKAEIKSGRQKLKPGSY